MKRLSCHIEIGDYKFTYANEVKVNSSWKDIADTATITLPNLTRRLDNVIIPGDSVKISLGYDDNNRDEFVGYVSSVSPDVPFRIECEDESYNLKRKTFTGSWSSITLARLIREVVGEEYNIIGDIPQITLSPFRIKESSAYQVLKKLRDEYLLAIYFRGKDLYVGLPYNEFPEKTIEGSYSIYHFQKNVAKKDLKFRTEDQVRIKVKAVSFLKNNTKITTEVGDADGELRTLLFQNITSESQLKAAAERKMAELKYSGYAGQITAFGIPFTLHSATVKLIDEVYPEREGLYLVDRVEPVWGVNGFRRKISVGPKSKIDA